MAYLVAEDPNITEDINIRKEFHAYKLDKNDHREYADFIIPRFMVEDQIQKGRYLQLHSYQLFVKNFINPNTPYSRLLLKWETGIGKTVGALSIAFNFINYYRKEQQDSLDEVGTVFIIGFSERVFKNELLRFPELGFISREEYKQLDKLKKLSSSGAAYEIDKLREFIIKIRKRFTNRKGYGFFKFIGYKAFVNRIFKIVDETINFNSLSEEEIRNHIKTGTIEINKELLDKFRNSLIICDEIHNVYNSLDKNNWGVAIQYVLDNCSTTRAIFMSATPLNNNPTEIIDLLNLLLPKNSKLEKETFFTQERELKPGALEQIAKYCQGRISFLRDVNPKYFPRRRILGEHIQGAKYLKFIRCPMSEFQYNTYKEVYQGALAQDSQYLIDFALPNPDPNSKLGLYQTQTIKKSLNYATQKWKDDNKISFLDNRIVGNFMQKETLKNFSTKYYRMINDLHKLILGNSGKIFIYHNVVHISGVLFIQELLLENGFLDEFGNSHDNTLCVICGNSRKEHTKEQLSAILGGNQTVYKNLEIFERGGKVHICESGEEASLISYKINPQNITINAGETNFSTNKTKIFEEVLEYLDQQSKDIYIRTKAGSPFSELLERKNFAGNQKDNYVVYAKQGIPVPEPDIFGGKKKTQNSNEHVASITEDKELSNADFHYYRPARFIVVHSEIEKNQLYQSLEKYNHPDNSMGHNFLILVGSKIVRESHDFKAIKNIYIMGRPDNIPMLNQIIGRAIRKNSHITLPIKLRNVDISIYTSCLPTKSKNGEYDLSYEEIKYKEKLHFYEIIQNIEKVFHENAIDAIINKDTIQVHIEDPFQSNPAEMIKHYNMLPYEPNVSKKFTLKTFKINELNLSTFDIFHYKGEITSIQSIIKRLYIELSPVWTYVDLFKMVLKPPFASEINTKIFDEGLFGIALSRLLWNRDTRYTEPYFEAFEGNFIEKILSPDDKYLIVPGGGKSVIVHMEKYYILFPLNETNSPIMDMEYSYRITHQQTKKKINLQGFMDNISTLFNYDEKRDKFYIKWKNVDITGMEPAIADFGLSFHIIFIEECIEYIFNLWVLSGKKSKMHEFYITMLYYYDARSLVIWASTAREFIAKLYKDYVIPVSLKLILKQSQDLGIEIIDDKHLSTDGIVNMLKSSINNSRQTWVPSEVQAHFQASKNRFDEFYNTIQKGKKEKIPSDILPIGHIMSNVPKFFHPDRGGWFESPEYVDMRTDFTENSLIIGYDEKIKNSVHIRFKIRPPIQNIKKSNDSRKIERGSVCNSSKSKVFLKEMSKKLGIMIEPKMNVNKLCDRIRRRLIYNELHERLNPKSNLKFFYFSYQRQPIF
jgi:hypothetical protein